MQLATTQEVLRYGTPRKFRERVRQASAHYGPIAAAGVRAEPGFGDLRDVITSVACRAYWRADDLRYAVNQDMYAPVGAAGTLQATGTSGAFEGYKPVFAKCTTAGNETTSRWAIYYDGGTAPAMTNQALPIVLTGLGSGITLSHVGSPSYPLNAERYLSVSGIVDRTGNTANMSNGAIASSLISRPGANSAPSFTIKGADTALWSTSISIPAPGTTPLYISAMVCWRGYWSASPTNGVWYGRNDFGLKFCCYMGSGDDIPHMANITLRSVAACDFTGRSGIWMRHTAKFTASASDYFQFGGVSGTTGASCGNSSATTFGFSTGTGTNGLDWDLAELSLWAGLPSGAEETAADTDYYTPRYGAGPLTA